MTRFPACLIDDLQNRVLDTAAPSNFVAKNWDHGGLVGTEPNKVGYLS